MTEPDPLPAPSPLPRLLLVDGDDALACTDDACLPDGAAVDPLDAGAQSRATEDEA